MTCSETREYAFAFLDSELDAPLSIELQRHLEHCPGCAREVEIERVIRKRLSVQLDGGNSQAQPDEETLRAAVMAVASHRQRPSLDRIRRWALAAAGIAAGLLVGVTAWLWSDSGDSVASRFSELVIADFQHVQDDGFPVQFASADPLKVATWLHAQTGLVVAMPPVQPTVYRLAGARKCKIAGRPAAFAMYVMGDTPVSFVVTSAEEHDVASMKRSDRGGQAHWVERHKGYTVVACIRENLLYAAVSTLGEEELLSLMADVTHESD